MMALRRWLADRLAGAAARRMRRRYPDWADAMLSEHASLADGPDRLGWAFGLLRASFTLPGDADLHYAALLTLSAATMTLYQWSADESAVTLAVLCLLSAALGVLRPTRFFISGLTIGAVVALVNGFETMSGVRPAYEIHAHSFAHDLRWLLLLAPALASSTVGRGIRLSLAA